MIKVYTYAVADLLHKGHRLAFKQAKALGDYLIVGILTDEATAEYKRWPIIPFQERMEAVADLRYVDEVVQQDSLDPCENVSKYKPDILTHSHSANEKFPGNDVEGFAEKMGIKLVRTEYYLGLSTTDLILRVIGRDLVILSRDLVEKYIPAEGNHYLGMH